jgi:hypothetical protein
VNGKVKEKIVEWRILVLVHVKPHRWEIGETRTDEREGEGEPVLGDINALNRELQMNIM